MDQQEQSACRKLKASSHGPVREEQSVAQVRPSKRILAQRTQAQDWEEMQHEENAPLMQSTVFLADLYKKSSNDFKYCKKMNPRRGLTKDCKGEKNGNLDNSSDDLIMYVNDVIRSNNGLAFVVEDLVGQGSFGQVMRCQMYHESQRIPLQKVAVKVIKNSPAYHSQALVETRILRALNQEAKAHVNKSGSSHIVQMLDSFEFQNHLCLVFPLLSVNLYELVRQNRYHGLPLDFIQSCVAQINLALEVLADVDIIHCDLKPENVLLEAPGSSRVKLIDFGSSCFRDQPVYTYIQSRFYRAPEVIVGLPYGTAIDMWSLGCLAVELYAGMPLFPGVSEHNQLFRIIEMRGPLPNAMLESGRDTKRFFKRIGSQNASVDGEMWRLLTATEWCMQQNLEKEEVTKRYIKETDLTELVMKGSNRASADDNACPASQGCTRTSFLDLLKGLLEVDPLKRWTAWQTKAHPFLTQTPLYKPFQPQNDLFSPANTKENNIKGCKNVGQVAFDSIPTQRPQEPSRRSHLSLNNFQSGVESSSPCLSSYSASSCVSFASSNASLVGGGETVPVSAGFGNPSASQMYSYNSFSDREAGAMFNLPNSSGSVQASSLQEIPHAPASFSCWNGLSVDVDCRPNGFASKDSPLSPLERPQPPYPMLQPTYNSIPPFPLQMVLSPGTQQMQQAPLPPPMMQQQFMPGMSPPGLGPPSTPLYGSCPLPSVGSIGQMFPISNFSSPSFPFASRNAMLHPFSVPTSGHPENAPEVQYGPGSFQRLGAGIQQEQYMQRRYPETPPSEYLPSRHVELQQGTAGWLPPARVQDQPELRGEVQFTKNVCGLTKHLEDTSRMSIDPGEPVDDDEGTLFSLSPDNDGGS